MRLALVADADLRERLRCVRAIASHTSLSAIGAGTWDEIATSVEGPSPLALVVYRAPIPGAPDDALERLAASATTFVLVTDDAPSESPSGPHGPHGRSMIRMRGPVPEETLVLLAMRAGKQSSTQRISFAPADFLQMVASSGDSITLIVSNGAADVGVIDVRDGAVWTAFDGLGAGEDAFARLLRPEMRARVRPAAARTKERTIHKDLSELLLDSLRRFDEGNVPAPPALSPHRIEDALTSPEGIAARVKQLHQEARSLMMNRKYDDAARVLTRLSELDPTSPIIRANLEQLRKLGYLR